MNGKPDVLSVLDDLRLLARPNMTVSDCVDFNKARAAIERLAGAGDRLLNAGYGQAIVDGRLGAMSDLWVEFRAALDAFRGDA